MDNLASIAFWVGFGLVLLVIVQTVLLLVATLKRSAYAVTLRRLETELFQEKLALAKARRKTEAADVTTWGGFRKFRVDRVADECDGVRSFYLSPHDGKPTPRFQPGQYLTFQVDQPGAPGRLVRCYSLSDQVGLEHYRVTIKRATKGLVSWYFHDQIKEGSILDVKAPAGGFTLDTWKESPVVLIGGGVGITPLYSMLRTSLAHNPAREIHLFYTVTNGRQHIFKEAIANIEREQDRVDVHVYYSSPLPEDRQGEDFDHVGRLTIDAIKAELQTNNFDFYICGPPPMMVDMVKGLQEWGVPAANINKEAFGPASVPPKPTTEPVPAGISVTFARSGKTLPWTGGATSLLAMAEEQGIETIDCSGCHAGSCGTCKTAIKSGRVSYKQEPDNAIEDGSCLACISVPQSDLILDA